MTATHVAADWVLVLHHNIALPLRHACLYKQLAIRAIPGNQQARPGDLSPHTVHRLDENLASTQLELAPADLQAIQQALAGIEIVGARYPAARAALVGR